MGDIVELATVQKAREATASDAWEHYAALSKRAQRTLDIQDGIAAGKAWRKWLDIFLGPRR